MAPLAGNFVGHYQIICQVGAGGMGTVFKAFDTTLQRTVALKFLTRIPPARPIVMLCSGKQGPPPPLITRTSAWFTPSRKPKRDICLS